MTQLQPNDQPILTGYDPEARLPYWAAWQLEARGDRAVPPAVLGLGCSLQQAVDNLYWEMARLQIGTVLVGASYNAKVVGH